VGGGLREGQATSQKSSREAMGRKAARCSITKFSFPHQNPLDKRRWKWGSTIPILKKKKDEGGKKIYIGITRNTGIKGVYGVTPTVHLGGEKSSPLAALKKNVDRKRGRKKVIKVRQTRG